MATTKIWSIKGTVGGVIEYIENPDKTKNLNYSNTDIQALRDVMDYAKNDFKTEKQYYVTGINCNPDTARKEMMLTKKRFGKPGGIVAFHGYQSFVEGEVTAEQAHWIGCEFARRVWGDRFEVVVATHLNTDHLHNHFVINSVSYVDGMKYYDTPKTYYNILRKISDEMCRENNLHVIENPQRGRSKHYGEHLAEKEGRPTLRSLIRADIDRAIQISSTEGQFFKAMEDMGYTFNLNPNRKYHTLKQRDSQRSFRFYSLGKGYDYHEIIERVYNRDIRPNPEQIKRLNYNQYYGKAERKRKLTGFQKLYVRYMFMMGIIPKGNPIQPVHPLIREAILKMQKTQQEYKLLARNHITTGEQLLFFKDHHTKRIEELYEQRTEITRLIHEEKNENKILILRRKSKVLTDEIAVLRREIKQCDNIIERTAKMDADIKQVEKEEKIESKEVNSNEHIRRSR